MTKNSTKERIERVIGDLHLRLDCDTKDTVLPKIADALISEGLVFQDEIEKKL